MRQQDDGVLSSPVSQGSDSGETPLFVGFSDLGNIVEQHWSQYGVYTHFLWQHVAEMMNEPQSGTVTFGLTLHDFCGAVKFHELRQNASAFRQKIHKYGKKLFDNNGPNPPSIAFYSAAVFDRSTLTVDGNVRIVWIEYQYLNCINISDVLCFFPETRPRNLDIRQHAANTYITTPPSSTSGSGLHHERVAGPRCTAVASHSIGGRDPSSVITASLSFAVLCMCVRCVARLARAAKNKNMDVG